MTHIYHSRIIFLPFVIVPWLAVFISVVTTSVLPAWCYSPRGDDCRWYQQCLSAKIICEPESDSYAIAFGETLCHKFTSQREEFSEIGQHWIDSTRACLQKKLVPVLTSNVPLTCSEVKAFAFDTHTECYLDPEHEDPSFCELPFSDWLRISWIVKGSFLSEPSASIKQAGQLLVGCASKLVPYISVG